MPIWVLNIVGWISLHKKIVIYCVLGLVLLGGVLYIADRTSTWWSDRKIDKAKNELKGEIDVLADLQGQKDKLEDQLHQIALEEASQKEIVKQKVEAVEVATEAERQARIAANESIANLNAVNGMIFTNSTLSNANKALCLAFPEECR